MDIIDKHLATAASDQKYKCLIQAALAVGKDLLNKYYNMTDQSEIYHIALGMSNFNSLYIWLNWNICIQFLHPSHKLDYFRSVDWEDDWMKMAEEIVHMEFERAYAGLHDGNETDETDSVCDLWT